MHVSLPAEPPPPPPAPEASSKSGASSGPHAVDALVALGLALGRAALVARLRMSRLSRMSATGRGSVNGETPRETRPVVGVLKCLNKINPQTSRAGYPFSLDDVDTAGVFALLVSECAQTGAKQEHLLDAASAAGSSV